ncbi:hypothetical protein B0H14DRAFT_3490276 [Mycena olivaceomarginata]|nr:hypothetical protein B0H14DRAFT_3490276 [Mycena olivaceomarginata]
MAHLLAYQRDAEPPSSPPAACALAHGTRACTQPRCTEFMPTTGYLQPWRARTLPRALYSRSALAVVALRHCSAGRSRSSARHRGPAVATIDERLLLAAPRPSRSSLWEMAAVAKDIGEGCSRPNSKASRFGWGNTWDSASAVQTQAEGTSSLPKSRAGCLANLACFDCKLESDAVSSSCARSARGSKPSELSPCTLVPALAPHPSFNTFPPDLS